MKDCKKNANIKNERLFNEQNVKKFVLPAANTRLIRSNFVSTGGTKRFLI